jgi:hypothetical protein
VQSGEEDVPTVAGGGHKSRSDVILLDIKDGNFTIQPQRNLLSLSVLNLMNATFLD